MSPHERSQLKVRLHSTAFGTTFLDVRGDILAAITEMDRVYKMESALLGLLEHAIPSNWDDGDDPEQVGAWLMAFEAAGVAPAWSGQ